MSDTPRTDALLEQWDDDGASRGSAYLELRDLALEIESELAAAKADAERLRAAARSFLQCYDEAPQDLNVKYHAAEFRAAITTKEKS
jgi:hypothetical protein